MALQAPQNPGERISQILPTVKCSNCGKPVALFDLGDHVCPPPPPSTPRPSAILAKIRQASQSISIPSPLNSSSTSSPRSSTAHSFRRSKTPQPAHAPPAVIPPPKSATPGPGMSSRQRSSSISRAQTPQADPRGQVLPPLPTSLNTAVPRFDSPPSAPPLREPQPLPQTAPPAGRFDTLPRSFSPGARGPSVSSMRDSRMRAPSASEIANRASNGFNSPVNGLSRSAPGPTPARPSMDASPRLSTDRPGSTRPSLDSRVSLDARPSYEGVRVPSSLSPLGPGAQRAPMAPIGMARPNGNAEGEVNMAGVGRRGFQAVAQAAMLAASLDTFQQPDRMRSPTAGMDGRRNNAPMHLNINAEVIHQSSSSSLSPNTPLSARTPNSASPHSPGAYPQPGIVTSGTSTSGVPFSAFPRDLSPTSPDTIKPTSARPPVSPAASQFSARYNGKELEIDTAKPSLRNGGPSSPSESDYSTSGLAYDQETESALSPTSPSTSVSTTRPNTKDRILFPSSGSPPQSIVGLPTRSASSSSSYSYASRSTVKSTGALDTLFEDTRSPPVPALPLSPQTKSPKLPMRSRTAPAMSSKAKDSSGGSETTRRPRQCTRCNKSIDDGRWIRAEGAGVLCERCWKTMYLPKCRRCNRPIDKQAVSSADGQLKGKYHRECFNCHKCQQPFPDKEFYVFDGKPFCRYHYHEANDSLCADPTCGQPIEGACAVAHTGERYHPEHLICEYRFSTSSPAPPTSPSAKGTQRCTERLEEYWEVDGLMLCEKHANMKMEMDIMSPDLDGAYADEDEDGDVVPDLVRGALRNRDSDTDLRALRRKTQFIDLR